MSRTSIAALGALFLAACSSSPADGTCRRREECGNLGGLTLQECISTERTYLDSLPGGDRAPCENALSACLDGAICDDFRECQANIDRTVCPCPNVTMTIVDPTDGQMIGGADDADPVTTMIEYDFVIDSSCLEELERVELHLLAPADSSYGYGTPDMAGRAVIRAPLVIPGAHRFVARGMTTPVMSGEITVDVSP